MVLAEDLDVDGPVVVVEAFKDISAHAKVLGPIHFVDLLNTAHCALCLAGFEDLLSHSLDVRSFRTPQCS